MNRRVIGLLVMMIATSLAAAACGGESPPPPTEAPLTLPTPAATPDLIAESVNQTVAAIAVAETVAALANPNATQAPATEVAVLVATDEPPPTATDEPPDVSNDVPTTPEVEETPLCRTLSGVNVRSGPGTAFDPPAGALAAGTEFTPLSYVARGFPQGEWLEAQLLSNGQIVWITANATFVTCNLDVRILQPPGVIPPTPRPTATPTPLPPTATPTRVVAGLPPDVDNDVPGGACERTDYIRTRIEENPFFLYRVYARDERAGPNDGDGIDFVRFTISDSFGTLYSREERVAGFCIFQGGEPDCRPWPFNEFGQFTWGAGGPLVQDGTYQVFIEVVSDEPDPATESNVCNWNFDMTVTLP